MYHASAHWGAQLAAPPPNTNNPEESRTPVTAVKGRRPKPLDDRVKYSLYFTGFFRAVKRLFAQPGLEPGISDPKSDVLPITPLGNGLFIIQTKFRLSTVNSLTSPCFK